MKHLGVTLFAIMCMAAATAQTLTEKQWMEQQRPYQKGYTMPTPIVQPVLPQQPLINIINNVNSNNKGAGSGRKYHGGHGIKNPAPTVVHNHYYGYNRSEMHGPQKDTVSLKPGTDAKDSGIQADTGFPTWFWQMLLAAILIGLLIALVYALRRPGSPAQTFNMYGGQGGAGGSITNPPIAPAPAKAETNKPLYNMNDLVKLNHELKGDLTVKPDGSFTISYLSAEEKALLEEKRKHKE